MTLEPGRTRKYVLAPVAAGAEAMEFEDEAHLGGQAPYQRHPCPRTAKRQAASPSARARGLAPSDRPTVHLGAGARRRKRPQQRSSNH